MRLLLDTHTLLWWLADTPLRDEARAAITDPSADVWVSAASAWEIAIKQALGRLRAPSDLQQQLERHRFAALPVTIAHALAAGALPHHHNDPFDRMLVAQAQNESMTIVTRDSRIGLYDVSVLQA